MAKALSRTVSIYIDGRQVDSTLSSIQKEQQRLLNLQKKLTIGTEEYIATGEKLKELNGILAEQRAAVRDVGNSWDSALNKMSNIANIISGLQSLSAMGDASIGTLKDLAADAAALDDAYADVMKTTGLTKEQVKALNEEFKRIDTRTSREDLNKLAYEAGKLGFNTTEAVSQFVRAADKINIALGDVLGDGAMVTVGKLADIYGEVTDQMASKDLDGRMLAIGSAINSLGQASTANEGYMVEFLKRLGGIATQARLSADQVLGFASALDQDGQAVEMAATAFQKLIQQMIKKPEEFLNAAKMSLGEFRRLMQDDMNTAIQRVLKGMDEMGSLNTLIPMFQDMGLDGARAATVVASLAGSLDKVADAQRIANSELATGSSVFNEFATKNSSLAAEAEKAKKRFQDMRIELGEQLYPVLIHLTKASTAAIKGISGYLKLWKENKAAAVALTGAMATLVGWYTRAYAIKLKEKVVDIFRQQQRKAEILQAKQQQLAEARLTAQREKAALAAIREQMSIQQKIIADHAEYAAMGQTNLVIVAQSNLRRLQAQYTAQATVATAANTAAMAAQKAVFASTPWGLVITALTSIVFATSQLVSKSREAKRELDDLNAQIGSETARANYLFQRLQDAERGTEDYTKAVNALKEAYPDLIQHYIDEEGYINNVAFARNQLIQKIREQIAEQRKLEKVQQIGSEFDVGTKDAASRIRAWYVKHYGDKQGQAMYEEQMAAMASDYDSYVNARKGVSKAESITGTSMPGGRLNFSYGGLIGAIEDYNAAVNAAVAKTKDLDNVYKAFGVTVETVNEKTKNKNGGEDDETETNFGLGDPSKELEKFEKVKSAIEETLLAWQNKQKAGIDQLFSEIDLQARRLRDRVLNSTGTDAQKQTLIGQIDQEAENLKRSKADEYLRKLTDEAAKLDKASSDNPLLQQVIDASRQLNAELSSLDAKAAQVRADLNQSGLSEADRARLESLLRDYERIRYQMQQRAYSAVDTSVDISGFAATGDAAKDAAKYAQLLAQIQRCKDAVEQLRDLQSDPAVAAEYQDQLDILSEQEAELRSMFHLIQQKALENEKGGFTKFLDKWLSDIEFFANKATELFSSINDSIANGEQKEYNDFKAIQDQKAEDLQDRLDRGIISQEQYDKQRAALDKQTEEREKALKLRQWERDKQLSIGEAVIDGALAILRVFSEKGNGITAVRVAQAALVGATTAAQIAAISSQPAPYAKGGYVPDRTYFMAGEAGEEWVASNALLTNPRTAPVISALEHYQRGNHAPLDAISMQGINGAGVDSTAAYLRQQAATDAAMLSELRQLRVYLSDPANRQVVLSRYTQQRFDANENFLRSAARI